MDVTEILIQNDFTCSGCNKRVPQIALAVDKALAFCNDCNANLFQATFCPGAANENELLLCILETTESQLKLLINEIRKKLLGKARQLEHIDSYWLMKTNGEFRLSDTGKKSLEKFFQQFNIEEIQDCIDIAFANGKVGEQGKFKYLCGILSAKLKERAHGPEYGEVLKYWNYKRPREYRKAEEGSWAMFCQNIM
ncbi:MAG: hypothetical protein WDM90_01045 [Ferruginibacter sp.]